MTIQNPVSDTSRAIQHESDQSWPESVKIQLLWRDAAGRAKVATQMISSDQFFGRGQFGAPMDGAYLIQTIERMRRAGPPKVIRRGQRQEGE